MSPPESGRGGGARAEAGPRPRGRGGRGPRGRDGHGADKASLRRGAPGRVLPPGPALLLFGVAFALRLAHVLAMRQSPYFNHPIIDALTYHEGALSIAAGHGHPGRVFWQPPGYSYFLALLY